MSDLILAPTETEGTPHPVNGGRWVARVKGLPAGASIDMEMRFTEDEGDDDWVVVDGWTFDGDKARAAFLPQDAEIRAKATAAGASVRVAISEAGVR